MRRRSWLLGLFYLLAAVLPLTAVARVCLPAAAMVARDLPAPEPRPPIVILAVETAAGPAVLVVETAFGRALLAVETAAGPRLFCLKTASGLPLSCAKTAAEYGVDWYAYPTDPVNQWDPMGLRTFLKVDDDARTVTMYMLVKYKPSKDLRLDSRQLTELARRHGQQVEKLFNEQNVVYADQYGHAPTVPNVVAERVTAFKGREAEEKLVELTRGTRKQYKGYTIRLSVVTTTDSNADEDLYDTFEIHPKIERENAGNLATNTTPEAVFHEYFHRLNLWDEYDRDKSDVHLDGSPKYKYNWLAEFKKNWKRAPEGDALMTCDGIKVYDRYVEAALFDLDNIEKGQRSWRTDKTHLLDKSDPYFDQARIENTEHRKIEDILKIIEGGSQPK